jgi:hypothetical protein
LMTNPATITISFLAIKKSRPNLRLLTNIRRQQLIIIRNIGTMKIKHLKIKKRKTVLNRRHLQLIQEVHQLKELESKRLHARPSTQIIGRKTLR